MAIITTGNSFGTTDAVTATKLNNIANAATFVSGAVDGTSLELISGGSDNGKLGIKDAGVTTAKVADSSSKTTGVTFAKMQHISTAKVLGRTSASEGDVEEVDLLDQDDMSSNSATSVATQQSIKAYVDTSKTSSFTPSTYAGEESVTLPNGLIMKFGAITVGSNATATVTFGNAFPNSCLVVNATFNENRGTSGDQVHVSAHNIGASSFQLTNATSSSLVGWQAFGY